MSKLLDFIRKNKEWRTLLKEAPYSLIIKEKTYEQDGKVMHVAIFNYNQIKSDKSDISREARGCIVDVDKCKFVCRGFDRFFNYGESTSAKIDWRTAVIEEKRDGEDIKK